LIYLILYLFVSCVAISFERIIYEACKRSVCSRGLRVVISGSAFAEDSNVKVTECAKNANATFVELSGESAIEIYSHISRTLNVPIKELGGVESNGMFCRPTSPKAVVCSFLMVGSKNIPYPQVDPGFSGNAPIACN